MAFLWHKTPEGWTRHQLADCGPSVAPSIALDAAPAEASSSLDSASFYGALNNSGTQYWLLLVALDACITVNGEPVCNGLRRLSDRDAIRAGALPPLYFSTEKPPEIQPFPGEESIFCPRCKLPIEKEQPAVKCPGCGVWHHECEAEARCCWTYADTCAVCAQASELNTATFRFSPEDL